MAFLHRLFLPFLIVAANAQEQRWKVNYFFDQADSTFEIRGMQFPSDQRGLAFGVISSTKEKEKPVVLITSNGGAKWTEVLLKEHPVALSCVGDSQCWLATDRGIWKSEESGRDWKKLKKMDGLIAIHFNSAKSGYASGYPKAVWKTTDGGLTWTALAESKKIESNAETSSYEVIAQNGNKMMIIGASRPKRRDDSLFPDWMEPERASSRREWPALTLMLDTVNGGQSWNATSASLFGHIQSVILKDTFGISLLVHEQSFAVPSEVMLINYFGLQTAALYREKDRAISSVYAENNKHVVIGGVEALGSFRANPIPSKVHILQGTLSENNKIVWLEMPVDYRAVARRVVIAGSPSGKLWAATDSGMILEWK